MSLLKCSAATCFREYVYADRCQYHQQKFSLYAAYLGERGYVGWRVRRNCCLSISGNALNKLVCIMSCLKYRIALAICISTSILCAVVVCFTSPSVSDLEECGRSLI